MRIGICVGEQSGDQVAAGLIKQLLHYEAKCELVGIGGQQLTELGCKNLFPLESISIMGVTAVLARLPQLLKLRQSVVDYFLKNPPDIFIGIDAPDFNLYIEEKLKKAGIKTVHYVSPTVWAWRRNRIKQIRRAVDLMLTLFPFEEKFYQEEGVPVFCVGHPLADRIPLDFDQNKSREALGLPKDKLIVAVMPGSRVVEMKQLGQLFVETSEKLLQQVENVHFVTSFVNEKVKNEFMPLLQSQQINENKSSLQSHWSVYDKQAHDVLKASDFVLATSGTVTLEALLFKKPTVVAYRMSKFNWFIARHMVQTKYCALPNLLTDQTLYPEFLQYDANSENLSKALMYFIKNPTEVEKLKQIAYFLHKGLQKNADEAAAAAVWELLKSNKG